MRQEKDGGAHEGGCNHLNVLDPPPVEVLLDVSHSSGAETRSNKCAQTEDRLQQSKSATVESEVHHRFATRTLTMGSPRSWVIQMSATVPPTNVEPVDAASPPRSRPTMTVACEEGVRGGGRDKLIATTHDVLAERHGKKEYEIEYA